MYIPAFLLVFMFVYALNHSTQCNGPSAFLLFIVIKNVLYYGIIIAMIIAGLMYGM